MHPAPRPFFDFRRRASRLALLALFAWAALVIGGDEPGAAQESPGLYTLPDARARLASSSSFVTAGDGLIVSANMLNNTATLVNLYQGERDIEIPVGVDPRTVALTPDGTRVVVANRGGGDLSVIGLADKVVTATIPVGLLPYGVVMLDDNRALVALQGTHEVVVVDLALGAITARIPTPPDPAGLALWGDFLYVTHLWSGQFSLIYLPLGQVVRTISTGADTALSQFVAVDNARGLAYLPQTRLNARAEALTFDTVAFPVVNVVDLRTLTLLPRARIALDTADRPVNMPFAAVLDSARRWLYVASAGSDHVTIIDLTSNLSVGSIETGFNPRGVLLSRDAGTLYVHNMIAGTITVYDTRTRSTNDVIPLSDLAIQADIQLGAQLFHYAGSAGEAGGVAYGALSADGWLSCATCHFDGQVDGRVWRALGEVGRTAPVLYGLAGRSRFNAQGTWDELADVELKIRDLHGGGGLIVDAAPNPPLGDPNAGRSLDLDNLTAYLASLTGPATSPPGDEALVARGAALFESLGCASCHAGESYTDGLTYDVGTGGEFVTPTLRWLWLSAPYLHDGRAATLRELFILPGAHQLLPSATPDDLDALEAYLLSLP
jgi:YVTN family beta-propeller protein